MENQAPLSQRLKTWMTISSVIALIGVIVSIYATSHHYELKAKGVTDAACNINDTLSCDAVSASAYSEVFGIPVAVWGIGYFLGMALLALIPIFLPKTIKPYVQSYTVLVGIGVLTSMVLAFISQSYIGALCPTCIVVYALTGIQAVFLFVYKSEIPTGFDFKNISDGGTTAAIAVAAAVLINNLIPHQAPADHSVTSNNTAQETQTLGTLNHNIPINKSPYSGLGEDYRAGGDAASVVVVEFSDFECPACRRASAVLNGVKKHFGQKLLFVYKNYPLDTNCNSSMQRQLHKYACSTAVMARCAGRFGKFWQYHDLAFAEQRGMKETSPVEWAKKVGLDEAMIKECQADKSIMEKIKDDIKLGNKLGVSGTPSIYINGRKYSGSMTEDALIETIENASLGS